MYKSQQQALSKVDVVLVATEFNKHKYGDIQAVKDHLKECKYMSYIFDTNDDDVRVDSQDVIGFQHQRICCGYLKETRVNTCSKDHVLVYAITCKEADSKVKQAHSKWISKL